MTSLCIFSLAAGSENLVVDDADILTTEEELELEKLFVKYSEENEASIAVLTTNDFEGKEVSAFADDYYDYNGYGYGENADGCLLVVNMETRDWFITTTGSAIYEIPDYVIDDIGSIIVSFLSEGDYFGAFENFAEEANYYLSFQDTYFEGEYTYNGEYYEKIDPDDYYGGYNNGNFTIKLGFNNGQDILVAIVIGIILSFITVSVMKNQLKSVRISTEAKEYMKADTLSITKTSDRFLYRNVTRTPKPKESSSSRGGGGGIRVGSSGRSHGGGGGKF